MKKHIKVIAFLAAGTLALSLTGCGKSLDNKTAENTAGTTPAAEGMILQGSDTEAKAKNNDLVIAMEGAVGSLDPANILNTSAISATRGIYEGLVKFDKDNKITGQLAKSWEISEDALTYTFHLNKGVKFHDGTDFNSKAVKTNFKRICKAENRLVQRRKFILTDTEGREHPIVSKVETPDESTVVFTLEEPWSPFINRLTQFSIISPAALKEYGNDISDHPCGTGPFTFLEWKEGSYIRFKRNDDYYGEKPGVDTVTMLTIPEAGARAAMLQAGEAQFLYPLHADQIKVLESTADINVIATESNIIRYVTLNTDLPQLKDKRVRQAMNYAIDKNAYAELMYDGYAKIATSTVPSIIQGYEKQIPYDYDLDKAKELMKEAGAEDGFDLTLWGNNTTQEIKGMAFIKQQLAQIGISVNNQVMDPVTIGDRIYVDKKDAEINMWYVNWSASDYTMDGSLRPLLYSTTCPPAGANASYYNSREFDSYLDEGLKRADPEKQKEAYDKAQEIAWNDCPWLFLVNDRIIYAEKTYLSNVYVAPDGSIDFSLATLQQ